MPRYYHPNPRDTTEGAKRIELAWLRKHNYLGGYSGGRLSWSYNGSPSGDIRVRVDTSNDAPYIEFDYKVKKHHEGEDKWREIKYQFQMESIPCRFGGKKWFFICGLYKSGVFCGSRVRNLYMAGDYFGCRKCANLSYQSCNESKRYRGMFKILTQDWKAEDYYIKNVKRRLYRGKPTRKYRRYLKIEGGYSERDVFLLEQELLAVDKIKKQKGN